MEDDLPRLDSVLAGVDRDSKVGQAWVLSRAMVDSTREVPLSTLGAGITEPEVFAYATGQLDGFLGQPELADSVVEYFETRPEWSDTDWVVGARLFSGVFDMAQGQWESGTAEFRRAADRNQAWALEFEALYAGLPDRNDRRSAAAAAHASLEAWTPSPADESLNSFMMVHTGYHPYLREYLLGLTEIWMDRPDDADDNIAALENAPASDPPGRFARQMHLSLRGHQAAARGDSVAALRWLEQVNLKPTLPQIVASPFFVRPQDRYLMAAIHEQQDDWEEAERWYRSLTEAWDFPYAYSGYMGLGRLALARGDEEQASDYLRRAGRRWGLDDEAVDRLRDRVRTGIRELFSRRRSTATDTASR
jgi:tetratricopeptide (TPR) repeat protein